jgi:class 3 adenylate cyclase
MQSLDALNDARAAAGVPVASVDLALHVGELLYGNVGAADRLDFTVIGPAINEVTRIEALCEPLDSPVLASAEFVAAAADADGRLNRLASRAARRERSEGDFRSLQSGSAPSCAVRSEMARGGWLTRGSPPRRPAFMRGARYEPQFKPELCEEHRYR